MCKLRLRAGRVGPLILLTLVGFLLPAGARAISVQPGDLFVLDDLVANGPLVHVDSATGVATTVAAPGAYSSAGILVDATGHLIYESGNATATTIVSFDPVSGTSTTLTSGGYLDDNMGTLSFGPQGQIVFTSYTTTPVPGQPGASTAHGSIVAVDATTGSQNVLYSSGYAPSGDVVFAPNGDLFYTSFGAIVRVPSGTTTPSFFLLDANVQYSALAQLPDGNLVVAAQDSGLGFGSVDLVDPATGATTQVAVTPASTGVTDVQTTASGEILFSACGGFDGCATGYVFRATASPYSSQILYSGTEPLSFAVVPLPEVGDLVLLGVAALALVGLRLRAATA